MKPTTPLSRMLVRITSLLLIGFVALTTYNVGSIATSGGTSRYLFRYQDPAQAIDLSTPWFAFHGLIGTVLATVEIVFAVVGIALLLWARGRRRSVGVAMSFFWFLLWFQPCARLARFDSDFFGPLALLYGTPLFILGSRWFLERNYGDDPAQSRLPPSE